jgi:hypothetical protein
MANRITRLARQPGSSVEFQARQRSADGGYGPASFGDETEVTCEVYAGQDSPILLTLPATWTAAGEGRVRVDCPAIDQDPGVYLAFIKADGVAILVFELELEDSPGSASFGPVYISQRDLTAELWQVESTLGSTATDGTGFADLRSQARDWLDDLILRSYRPGHSASPYSFNIPWHTGDVVGAKWLSDALAAGALLLTSPSGKRLKRAMTYWVLARILQRSAVAGQAAQLLDLAAYYAREADNLVMSSIAEIDTDGDGIANYTINLGVTRTRYC